jgi:hypothetical protein
MTRCVFVLDIREMRSNCGLKSTVSGRNASRALRSAFLIAREERVQLRDAACGRG